MSHVRSGFLVLALAVPALGTEEKPAGKLTSAAEQYQALVKAHQDAMQAYSEALGKAKTYEERMKVFAEESQQGFAGGSLLGAGATIRPEARDRRAVGQSGDPSVFYQSLRPGGRRQTEESRHGKPNYSGRALLQAVRRQLPGPNEAGPHR